MINYDILVELCGERSTYTDIVFTSGDMFAYRLNFAFFENGKPVDVSDCTLLIKAKRQDGVVITDAGYIKDGLAYVDIKNSMIALSGEVSFEIALCGSTGSYITTKELIAHVREGHGDGDIRAEDTAPVLSSLLIAASEIKSTANDAKTLANDAKTVANDAKTLASDAKKLAVDTYNRESIDAFMDSKADKLTVYKEIENAKPFIASIDLEENESGGFDISKSYYPLVLTQVYEAIEQGRDVILKTNIVSKTGEKATVYSSSITYDEGPMIFYGTVFYDYLSTVRIITIKWDRYLIDGIEVLENDIANLDGIYEAIEDAKPFIYPVKLEKLENGQYSVSESTQLAPYAAISNAIEQGRDVILKVNMLPDNKTLYSSSLLFDEYGAFTWVFLYQPFTEPAENFTIILAGDSFAYYVGGFASKAQLDASIGDIETSLENIITKYGLGGDTQ